MTVRRFPTLLLAAALLSAGCQPSHPEEARDPGSARGRSGDASRRWGDASRRSGDASRRWGDARGQACGRAPAYRRPARDRPRYALRLDVRPAARVVDGRLSVTFSPDLPTHRLVFRLWPNGPHSAGTGTHLATGPVSVDGRRASSRLADPTTLVVSLPAPLASGERTRASLAWRLDLPGPVLDRISQKGTSIRLGSFFPLLASEPGSGWAADPPSSTLAETSSSAVADFDVSVNVPRGLEVLATGVARGPRSWRATSVRDFAMAVGRFDLATRTVRAPAPVEVTVGVEQGLGVSPREFLARATRALQRLSARFGPYPWPTFHLAVMPDLGRAGIEYPSMVFQGAHSLEFATTHEVAHMWFYSLVGSNPARAPWMDEAVASWAAAVSDHSLAFFQQVPVPEPVRGRLGKPMTFWDRHEDDYFQGVYAQGVQALHELGPAARVDCALGRYVALNAYRIAEPRDLVGAMTAFVPGARRTLASFGVRP